MHTTKTDILALLKRSDGATVDDLACALELASMTVRQHLATLERDSLIASQEVRRPGGGRPHFLYRLSPEGHRHVASGYDRLLALIVAQAGIKDGAADPAAAVARRRDLFASAAAALALRHRDELRLLVDGERIARVADILRSHGGFAEWHDLGAAGFELRDFGCVFRMSVSDDGPCAWHETFLREALEAEISAPAEPAACAACCRYVIAAAAPVSIGSRGP